MSTITHVSHELALVTAAVTMSLGTFHLHYNPVRPPSLPDWKLAMQHVTAALQDALILFNFWNLLNFYDALHTILLCHGYNNESQTHGFSSSKGIGDWQALPTNWEAIDGWWIMERPFCLQSVYCLSRLTILQWMVPNPGVSGQGKLDLVGYIQKQDTKLEGMGWIWKKLREQWGK